MTCIVGLVEDGQVFIGGDRAGVGGWALTLRKDVKVFRNGDFLIGGTSSFRMVQLLHHAFIPPVYDENISIEKFMSTAFVDAIRQCFKDGGWSQKSNEQESAGVFLVGFRGRLFEIESDYQVGESLDGFNAVGCGSDVALGVLYATPNVKPRKRVEMALQGAEHLNAGVRGPFLIEVLEAQ